MPAILSALNLDALPQLSLGTAALLIFGAIASLAVLRGLLRILWGTAVLCVASFAAFYAWLHAHQLALKGLPGDPAWTSIALPVLCFILTFFLLRAIGRFVVRPWGKPNEDIAEENRRSPIRWAVTLLLSLIPTSLLWFAGATLVRHAGSLAELRTYADKLAQQPVPESTSFLAKLKENIESTIPSSWFSTIDPVSSDLRLTLAKLISSGDEPPPKALPVLEEPAMRELILGDPELRQLAREGRYSEILRDPRLDQILENPDVRQVLNGLDL